MTAQGDLVAFLDRVITEHETTARHAAHESAGRWTANHEGYSHAVSDDAGEVVVYNEGAPSDAQSGHIALHDPESVLRRCAADRKLIELHAGRMHSCPAKDETGYLDEWTHFGYDDACPALRLLAEGYGWTEGER